MNFETFIYTLVIFLLGLFSPILKEWVLSKTKYGVKHGFDTKLEHTKSSLAKEAAFHASAFSAFADGQQAAMERRLSAIDQIWKCLLEVKKSLPPILYWTDVLTVGEHEDFIKKQQYQELKGNWTMDKIVDLVPKNAEELRPFLDEYIWYMYFAYQSIFLRASLLICEADKAPIKIRWFDDEPTKNIIKSVLSDEEYAAYEKLDFQKVSYLQRTIENKILQKMRERISGEGFVKHSIDQIQKIENSIAEAQIKNADMQKGVA